jgi:ketosteroid isomerase-like protein
MSQSEMLAFEIRSRITQMLRCRMSGQIDRMLRYFAPNTVVHCASSREGLLPPGIWEGADALRSITRRTDENYEPLEHEILDILVDGQNAVVRWRGAWRRHATGKIYMIDAAHFLRWQNGLVVEMHEFFEHASNSRPCGNKISSYEDLLTQKSPGFDLHEIERRARQLVGFPSNGPEIDMIVEFCSPDIICDFVGDRARIPCAGRHVGVDALINIVRAVAVDFEQSHCEISEILVEEGRVAGRRKVEWRHRGTGRRGWVDLANFVRFEDSMIVELVEFRDSVTLLEMQGEMEARLGGCNV